MHDAERPPVGIGRRWSRVLRARTVSHRLDALLPGIIVQDEITKTRMTFKRQAKKSSASRSCQSAACTNRLMLGKFFCASGAVTRSCAQSCAVCRKRHSATATRRRLPRRSSPRSCTPARGKTNRLLPAHFRRARYFQTRSSGGPALRLARPTLRDFSGKFGRVHECVTGRARPPPVRSSCAMVRDVEAEHQNGSAANSKVSRQVKGRRAFGSGASFDPFGSAKTIRVNARDAEECDRDENDQQPHHHIATLCDARSENRKFAQENRHWWRAGNGECRRK